MKQLIKTSFSLLFLCLFLSVPCIPYQKTIDIFHKSSIQFKHHTSNYEVIQLNGRQWQVVQESIGYALANLERIIAKLDQLQGRLRTTNKSNLTGSEQALLSVYERWFGEVNSGQGFAQVLDNYNAVRSHLSEMNRSNFRYDTITDSYAYILGDYSNVIYLCAQFFNSADSGINRKDGVLIHEVSHLAFRSEDHAYGVGPAEVLAQQEPQFARMNADNYEFFYEDIKRVNSSRP